MKRRLPFLCALAMHFALGAPVAGAPVVAQASVVTDTPPRTLYVAAGASGDGLSAATPFGSTREIEAASAPGDIIVVLPGDGALDGGLALKPDQIVRGVAQGTGAPVITNETADRNGGVGVVLSSGVRIHGVAVRGTRASGIFGHDVTDVAISDVTIENVNTSSSLVDSDPLAPFPHGGVALTTSPGAGDRTVTLEGLRVVAAAGMGIGTVALAGTEMTLRLQDVEVTGGAGIGNADYGIAALALGPAAVVSLEMTGSRVGGRASPAARNVALGAGEQGTARGLIHESEIGESGQDGILATTLGLPANVDLRIVGSTIEDAAQSNVEGTFLAFPHERADLMASSMAISIHRSTIRDAGRGPLFGDTGSNVLMTGSFIPPDLPLAAGRYTLRVTDSEVGGSTSFGVALGSFERDPTADPGSFDVLLRGNRFYGNGAGDIMVGTPGALVDARGNCWSSADTGTARVTTWWGADTSSVDTSAARSCER